MVTLKRETKALSKKCGILKRIGKNQNLCDHLTLVGQKIQDVIIYVYMCMEKINGDENILIKLLLCTM